MKRRDWLQAFGAAAVSAAASFARGQPARKVPVVGVLVSGPEAQSNSLPALRRGLQELGYIEGSTIALELRAAGAQPDTLAALATDLVRLKVDALYVVGPAAVRAVRNATNTIPVVALDFESDPVEVGWASSLSRPGGNLTGLFLDVPALAGKWLELLGAVVPGMKRVGVLWDSTAGTAQLNAARTASRVLGLELAVLEVRRPEEIEGALRAAAYAQARGLLTLSSPLVEHHGEKIAEHALANRLPSISMFQRYVSAGGLMSYGPDQDEFYRNVAPYLERILKGAKPGDLPIVQPAKFRTRVNMKTAKLLSVTIPPALLQSADEVIE